MNENIFLKNTLYEILFKRLKITKQIKEKHLQIVLGNVLHNNFGIKRIFNEPNYRYYDKSRKYYSDIEINNCKNIKKKKFAKRCDIRILSPASWIELKLNSKIDKKDIQNLFGIDGQAFTNIEDRYSINIWTKKKLKTIKKEIEKFNDQIEETSIFNTTLLQISDAITVVIFYKLNNSSYDE